MYGCQIRVLFESRQSPWQPCIILSWESLCQRFFQIQHGVSSPHRCPN
uniref:Uncharacterized protein n=1 Tax=Rhizophora mucronata TaxID=61149 RepID=A0A2P2PIK4_RHIMU